MNIRLGYEGNSKILENCSTNRTVSVIALNKLANNEKKIAKLKKVAKQNILDTERILKNNFELGIMVYGLSPKLFPLPNYPELEYFRYIDGLKGELLSIGNFIKETNMRVNVHLQNTIILNSLSEKVYEDAIKEIKYQNVLLNTMGLGESYKIIVNVGGLYINKEDMFTRFNNAFSKLDEALKKRIVLENDDNSIGYEKMLDICNSYEIPYFLNVDFEKVGEGLISKSIDTWKNDNLPALFGVNSNEEINKLKSFSQNVDAVLNSIMKDKELLGLPEI